MMSDVKPRTRPSALFNGSPIPATRPLHSLRPLRVHHVVLLLLASGIVLLMCSCVTTINSTSAQDGATYIGLVHVRASAASSGTPAPVLSISSTTVGVRIRQGLSIGVLQDQELRIPMDCRLVLLVHSDQQLKEATLRLAALPENVCVSVDHTL